MNERKQGEMVETVYSGEMEGDRLLLKTQLLTTA